MIISHTIGFGNYQTHNFFVICFIPCDFLLFSLNFLLNLFCFIKKAKSRMSLYETSCSYVASND